MNFTDLIKDEFIHWTNGFYILNGGTATGKSYFIINTLANYYKNTDTKILIISNRARLNKQVKDNAKKFGTNNIITSKTYQAIQNDIVNNIPIKHYDFIVCDEAHYLTSDAEFIEYTDLMLKFILSQKNSKVILMSATADTVFNFFKIKKLVKNEYIIEKNYDYVESLTFYNNKDDVEVIISNILKNTNDKVIYFSNNANFAYDIYKKFKRQADFYCSKNNKKYHRYSNDNCINNSTFKSRLLVTTVALDNGVDIIDSKLKHIISDVFDVDKMLQCLGRKRIIDSNDTCKFYLLDYNKNFIGGKLSNVKHKTNAVLDFYQNRDTFIEKHQFNRNLNNDIFYFDIKNSELKVNDMRLFKYLEMKNICIEMLDTGYKNYVLSKLKIDNIIDIEAIEELQRIKTLSDYLESLTGKILLKDDKQELIHTLNFKVNGRLLKSYKTINAVFEELNIEFLIVQKRKNSFRYWVIEDTNW